MGLLCCTELAGISIYGKSYPNEGTHFPFSEPGLVCCYTEEPNKNSSQFMITLKAVPAKFEF